MSTDGERNFFRVGAEDFKKIPGSPIAYWVSKAFLSVFDYPQLGDCSEARVGMATGRNDYYVRFWSEISLRDFGVALSRNDAKKSNLKWFPYNKGGEFRRWYGNRDCVVNWRNDGYELQTTMHPDGKRIWAHNFILDRIFKSGISWTVVSSGKQSFRYSPQGCLFDAAAGVCQAKSESLEENQSILLFFNSCVADFLIKLLNPTINLHPGYIEPLPFVSLPENSRCDNLLTISKTDWDSYETSWDFKENPLIAERAKGRFVRETPMWVFYECMRKKWAENCEQMHQLEMVNNRIFIDAYGLQDELSADVPWNEITLTCNPWYRYGKCIDKSNQSFIDYRNQKLPVINDVYEHFECSPDGVVVMEPYLAISGNFPYDKDLELRLLQDTIKEFISYAVGCMMGRYSFDKPGLILANQGETYLDYLRKITDNDSFQNPDAPESLNTPSALASMNRVVGRDPYRKLRNQKTGKDVTPFADVDGVLPILDDEWFMDDIVAQFKAFLTFTFGEENFTQNLQFIEGALGKDLRKYFIKDFYKEHVQRYKKRPIYWLFSSPKGSFNALIYMHRYRPDTVSIVLNDYLREYITKLAARREHLIAENNRADLSGAARTRNLKLIDKYASMLAELEAYERDILFPLAQKKIAIDLDDGVKVNYCKFGDALRKIPGLEAKEE